MRLGVSVMLLVLRQKQDQNFYPKGFGHVASRQGLSYQVGRLRSRVAGRDWQPVVRRQLARCEVPEGLSMDAVWVGSGRARVGVVGKGRVERTLRPSAAVRTRS